MSVDGEIPGKESEGAGPTDLAHPHLPLTLYQVAPLSIYIPAYLALKGAVVHGDIQYCVGEIRVVNKGSDEDVAKEIVAHLQDRSDEPFVALLDPVYDMALRRQQDSESLRTILFIDRLPIWCIEEIESDNGRSEVATQRLPDFLESLHSAVIFGPRMGTTVFSLLNSPEVLKKLSAGSISYYEIDFWDVLQDMRKQAEMLGRVTNETRILQLTLTPPKPDAHVHAIRIPPEPHPFTVAVVYWPKMYEGANLNLIKAFNTNLNVWTHQIQSAPNRHIDIVQELNELLELVEHGTPHSDHFRVQVKRWCDEAPALLREFSLLSPFSAPLFSKLIRSVKGILENTADHLPQIKDRWMKIRAFELEDQK